MSDGRKYKERVDELGGVVWVESKVAEIGSGKVVNVMQLLIVEKDKSEHEVLIFVMDSSNRMVINYESEVFVCDLGGCKGDTFMDVPYKMLTDYSLENLVKDKVFSIKETLHEIKNEFEGKHDATDGFKDVVLDSVSEVLREEIHREISILASCESEFQFWYALAGAEFLMKYVFDNDVFNVPVIFDIPENVKSFQSRFWLYVVTAFLKEGQLLAAELEALKLKPKKGR